MSCHNKTFPVLSIQLLFYMEACESGSMFEYLLAKNRNSKQFEPTHRYKITIVSVYDWMLLLSNYLYMFFSLSLSLSDIYILYEHVLPLNARLLWLFISLVLFKKNSLFVMILQQFWQWLLPMLPPPPMPATLTRRGRLTWEMSSVWSGWKTRIRLINYSKNNHTFLLIKAQNTLQ